MFDKDTIGTGVVLTLGSEVVTLLLLWSALSVASACGAEGLSLREHPQWLAAMFIPTILLLRHYVKHKRYLVVAKAMIVALFVTFVAFMLFLHKNL